MKNTITRRLATLLAAALTLCCLLPATARAADVTLNGDDQTWSTGAYGGSGDTLTLGGTNTKLTIDGAAATFATVTSAGSSMLTIAGGTASFGTVQAAGTLTIAGGTTNITGSLSTTGNFTISGGTNVIHDASITAATPFIAQITGGNTRFTGGLTAAGNFFISGGTVEIDSLSSSTLDCPKISGSANVTIGTVGGTGSPNLTGGTTTVTNAVNADIQNSGGTLYIRTATGTGTVTTYNTGTTYIQASYTGPISALNSTTYIQAPGVTSITTNVGVVVLYRTTLHANGGLYPTNSNTLTIDNGYTANPGPLAPVGSLTTDLTAQPEPTRDGYLFLGYTTQATGGVPVTTLDPIAHAGTLYAQWQPLSPHTAAITAFSLLGVPGAISGNAITVTLPEGTDVTSLTPAITHTGSAIAPAASAAQNFSSPVQYTVTAQDGVSTNTYTVTVVLAPVPADGDPSLLVGQLSTQPTQNDPDGLQKLQHAVIVNVNEFANVRSGPGTSYPISGEARLGEELRLIAWSQDGLWCHAYYNGGQKAGWIYYKFISVQ